MNNLNEKYKTVKDKGKSIGEGNGEIKSFPEFKDLDELWGTRDTVTNEYVVEAGSNDQAIDETSTEGSDHDESEEEDLRFDAPLSSSLRRKRKQPLKETQTVPPVTPVKQTKAHDDVQRGIIISFIVQHTITATTSSTKRKEK